MLSILNKNNLFRSSVFRSFSTNSTTALLYRHNNRNVLHLQSQLNSNSNKQDLKREYSQHSISNQQVKVEIKYPEKKPNKSYLLRLLALLVVGKISWDTVTSFMAYQKGSKPIEQFLHDAWNEVLQDVYHMAVKNNEVIKELGGPVTMGPPPQGSTSPITELSRELFVGLNIPKAPKDIDNWYLKPVIGQPQQKQAELENKPVLVAQPNSWITFPYCETTSEVTIPIRGKNDPKSTSIIHAVIYANDDRWRILSAKVIHPNGKVKVLIEPDIKVEQPTQSNNKKN